MRVFVLRHAKSDWDAGASDFERPLNDRGRREALRMADHVRENGIRPDVVVCSPAARARETLAVVAVACDDVRVVDALYGAEADDIRDVIAAIDASSVMVVGHDPGLSDFVGTELKTCTLATVDLDGNSVTLVDVVSGKDLG